MFVEESSVDGLAGMSPGSELAVKLDELDRYALSNHDRVELLKARARLRSHIDAELMADMVAVLDAEAMALESELPVEEVHEAAAAEIQAALHLTRRAAERRLDFASTLVTDYPQVWKILQAGLIDLPRAGVIVDQTSHLDSETRDKVVEVALERAPSQTTGLLAARIRRLAIWVDPDTARERYQQGLEERRVVSDANDDGTANLIGLQLSATETQTAMRKINRIAQQLKSVGDPRNIDQIRADVFLDLIRGHDQQTGPDRAVVDIQVDLTTLLELDDKPGEIPGWGPVISDIARQTVDGQRDSEWRYTVTDENGNLVDNGTTRRRPTTRQRRTVQSRAPTCVFPGCRMPALDCDIDHNQPWAEHGQTEEDNLGPLCRRHHVIRHHGWTIIQTQPGIYQLTSPLGQTYTSQPRSPLLDTAATYHR
jgi:hypothetical protein